MLTGRNYSALDYAWMAWRRRWILLVPVFAGVFASLLVSSRLADQYQSETLIQIVPQQVPNSYVQSTVTMRTEDRLNALRQQVLSRTELERLIVAFNLYPGQRERLPMQDVVELMRENTTVEPVASMRTGARRWRRCVLHPLQVCGAGDRHTGDPAARLAVHRSERARSRRAGRSDR